MVSQKTRGERSNMDIRNIKRDAGKLQDSTGFEKKKEGGGGLSYGFIYFLNQHPLATSLDELVEH